MIPEIYPHYRDSCVCRDCRKLRAEERRSMEPLRFWDSVLVWGSLGVVTGLVALLVVIAWGAP